jgi:hypothetical protein
VEDVDQCGPEGVGTAQVSEETVCQVFDNFGIAACAMGKGRDAASHCLEEGVRKPLVNGRDHEQIERAIPQTEVLLESCKMDALSTQAGASLLADTFLSRAATTDKDNE